jgi:SOS response regulatory protein OraA/RecX
MRLYRQTIEDFGLYSGMELTEDELKKLRTAAGAMSAKMRAVRIVATSSVSKRDLEQRLVQKGEDRADAQNAVAWMSEMQLVDDRKTAEQVVARCIAKGYGLSRAKQALFEKKIPKEYWDQVLAEYPDQTDTIAQYLQSHLTNRAEPRDVKKAIDALIRRGHSYGRIRRVLEQLSFETEDLPEE